MNANSTSQTPGTKSADGSFECIAWRKPHVSAFILLAFVVTIIIIEPTAPTMFTSPVMQTSISWRVLLRVDKNHWRLPGRDTLGLGRATIKKAPTQIRILVSGDLDDLVGEDDGDTEGVNGMES
ncbi:hypothetical protein BDQ17DRAFT_1322012 [Cyathus striatus]|nr:hypothetical protein BDQ17DRAFT_1322012 [Cyathus striatus]